ncbi:hypothetical protein BD770DRAFT_409130 [Pilaira anomala]|nr:hypothetical protein BD770DRAFT_409130 [Pilaira anomala]
MNNFETCSIIRLLPWFVFPTQNNLAAEFYRDQESIFDSNNNRIYFFGGISALLDYCFTLNLHTHQWKQQYIRVPDNTELIRTRHSAVTVDNYTLFIIFGKSQIDIALSSIVILNYMSYYGYCCWRCGWKESVGRGTRKNCEEPVIEADWEEIDSKYGSYNPSPNNNHVCILHG